MANKKTKLWVVAAVLLSAVSAVRATVELDDSVSDSGRSGTDVVLLSIAYIHQATIFPDDNKMLRRLAFVETQDGLDEDSFNMGNSGGIWAVKELVFENTKSNSDSDVVEKRDQIRLHFDINWDAVQWSELNKPLYSALAARLVLFIAPEDIPSEGDILSQARFWREYYHIDGPVDPFVDAVHELEGNSNTENSASEFFVGFARTHPQANPETNQRLFVTTRDPNPVPFTVESFSGVIFSGNATFGKTTVVELENRFLVLDSTEREKGLRVSAGSKKIVVYGLNFHKFTSDAFVALPCMRQDVDEYVYYGVTYDIIALPSQLLFVGCEDDTTIRVTSASLTISLDTMETYLYEQDPDLSGIRVVSDKPIVFYSGHVCANVRVPFCDHLVQQLPNTATWGRKFLSASLDGRSSEDVYRIVASQPSTSVTFTCSLPAVPTTATLNAGDWQEFSTPDNSFCAIESDKPIEVVQFALGGAAEGGLGDPFMMMLPAIEQFSNNYVISLLPEFRFNYITLLVAPEYYQPDMIYIDDVSQEGADWAAINCTDSTLCGYALHANLSAGDHRLYHANIASTIGVSAYGFNVSNSYGYPGGVRLLPNEEPVTIVSFTQDVVSVSEDDGILTLSVERYGDTESQIVVLVATVPQQSTATAGEDYLPVAQILEFLPGMETAEVNITIIDDKCSASQTTLVVQLSSEVGVVISPFAKVEITIEDDDNPTHFPLCDSVMDIVSDDALFTVPINVQSSEFAPGEVSLCYEVYGEPNKYFNLISAFCLSVNAHFSRPDPTSPLYIIDEIAVVATNDLGQNVNISVDDQCTMSIGGVETNGITVNGITVDSVEEGVVVIHASNNFCMEQGVLMTLICEKSYAVFAGNTRMDVIRFTVNRGLALNEMAHGLLDQERMREFCLESSPDGSQFWYIPISVEEFVETEYHLIQVPVPSSAPRQFFGVLYGKTWQLEDRPCLYVGDSQGGPDTENGGPPDSVIEGEYTDYMTDEPFHVDFRFSRFGFSY